MITRFVNWMYKKYGNCVFGHVDVTVLDAGYTNCVYKCKECGEIFMAR
jgi:hypothetical protein